MKASFKFFSLIYLIFGLSQFASAEVQRTLSIIKPDAVSANHIGEIVHKFEQAGLKVVAAKMLRLTPKTAGEFYAVHKERPFYESLVTFMTEGPVFVQVLEGENAIQKNRDIMGATNPASAKPGTIRAAFAESVQRNAVHGSDAPETAEAEINFFFGQKDIG